jgi:hypothetical protein
MVHAEAVSKVAVVPASERPTIAWSAPMLE